MLAGMDLQQALLYDTIRRSRDRQDARRRERERIRSLAARGTATPYCSRCGRRWRGRHYTLWTAWAIAVPLALALHLVAAAYGS